MLCTKNKFALYPNTQLQKTTSILLLILSLLAKESQFPAVVCGLMHLTSVNPNTQLHLEEFEVAHCGRERPVTTVNTVNMLHEKETGCLSLAGLSYTDRRRCVLPRMNLSLRLLNEIGISLHVSLLERVSEKWKEKYFGGVLCFY